VTTARVIHKDNGYFETIRLSCGCVRRVVTEDIQWRITAAKRKAYRDRAIARHRCDAPTSTREMH
jgi:hypothetical protein